MGAENSREEEKRGLVSRTSSRVYGSPSGKKWWSDVQFCKLIFLGEESVSASVANRFFYSFYGQKSGFIGGNCPPVVCDNSDKVCVFAHFVTNSFSSFLHKMEATEEKERERREWEMFGLKDPPPLLVISVFSLSSPSSFSLVKSIILDSSSSFPSLLIATSERIEQEEGQGERKESQREEREREEREREREYQVLEEAETFAAKMKIPFFTVSPKEISSRDVLSNHLRPLLLDTSRESCIGSGSTIKRARRA